MSIKRIIFIASGAVALFIILVFGVYGAVVLNDAPNPTPIASEPMPQETVAQTEDLGFGYTKKNNKIYFQDGEVVGADPNTFVALREYCAKDVNSGYAYGVGVPMSDPNTFVCLGGGYAKDAKRVFYNEQVVAGADVASFEVSVGPSDGVHDIGEKVQFAKDKNYVYAEGAQVEGADPKTFAFSGYAGYSWGRSSFIFATDTKYVYANFVPFKDLDPASFSVDGNYAKDKDNVYYVENETIKRVEGADSNTFVRHDTEHTDAADKTYVFSQGQRIGYADNRLELVGGYYAKDKNSVYFKLKKVPGVDVHSFQFLGNDGYAKDKNYVYFDGKHLEGADAPTFQTTNRIGYAKDKDNQYAFGEKVKNDFAFCSTDLQFLPTLQNWHLTAEQLDGKGFEFCKLKDGNTLIGFLYTPESDPPEEETYASKQYYLYDNAGKLINEKPAILSCADYSSSRQRSLDVLDGAIAKVQCQESGGCDPLQIHHLNLDKMKTDPENAFSKSDEYYDCGYRG